MFPNAFESGRTHSRNAYANGLQADAITLQSFNRSMPMPSVRSLRDRIGLGRKTTGQRAAAHRTDAAESGSCASSVHRCIDPIHDAINAISRLRNTDIDIF
ncbi:MULTISPECIES: hypothetical protein [unclassified Burkholderia]|uniref:hypothetical protein n=1 Tax=unclassified Burkholderia TaxID=2613784 RepID=UPI00159F2C22|nr:MULTISPECIES: hypothetical protein [unclassified Burkholderia]MBR8236854.1 hypothetical protein [Burkholderia sp. AU32357]MBY4877277.1 hypothetical protein [Burkholderia sp. AU42008]